MDVPPEIGKLLTAYKNRSISKDDEEKLFDYLYEVDDVKGLVTSPPFNYTKRDYNRLMAAMSRRRISPQTVVRAPERELQRIEGVDFKKFISQMWSQVKDIGMETVMRWVQRASELGYYDPDTGTVDMHAFVNDACEFYIKYAPKLEEMEQDKMASQAMVSVLSEAFNRTLRRLYLVKITVDALEMAHPRSSHILVPLKRILPEGK